MSHVRAVFLWAARMLPQPQPRAGPAPAHRACHRLETTDETHSCSQVCPKETLLLSAANPLYCLTTVCHSPQLQANKMGKPRASISPCATIHVGTGADSLQMIILIRHAQSEGNKNRDIHQFIPDHRVKLTPDGWQQVSPLPRFAC